MRRLAAALVLAAASLGCAKQDLIDVVMGGAPHPARAWPSEVEGLRVLSGDTHCHVAPPDAPSHVSRGLTDAIALAREERLDFVILTPHVRARFFADPALREHFVAGHRALQGEIARLPGGSPTVVAGFEYTDYAYGHAGLAFGDALAVLDRHSAGELAAAPERFFEAYAATGGLAVINHPAVVPVPSPFAETSADMSFRPFVQPAGGAYPPEITWLARHADAIETFNLGITYLRDRLVVGDLDATTRESHHLLDVRVRRDQRRIASVGGSDSHGMHLRAVTWVLARDSSPASIRGAIRCGRTCVRGPEACRTRARAPNDLRWVTVGGALAGREAIVDVPDEDSELFVDGAVVPGRGRERRVHGGAGCATLRVRSGASVSGPIYLGCDFALSPPCM